MPTTAPQKEAVQQKIDDLERYLLAIEQQYRAFPLPTKPDVSALPAEASVAAMMEYEEQLAAARVESNGINDRITATRNLLAQAREELAKIQAEEDRIELRSAATAELEAMMQKRQRLLAAADMFNAAARDFMSCDQSLITRSGLKHQSEMPPGLMLINLRASGEIYIEMGTEPLYWEPKS